jgi:hypothetical protein
VAVEVRLGHNQVRVRKLRAKPGNAVRVSGIRVSGITSARRDAFFQTGTGAIRAM